MDTPVVRRRNEGSNVGTKDGKISQGRQHRKCEKRRHLP